MKADHHSNQWGVTLLELMIALSLTAIVITTVYFTWNYLNRHVALQKRRSTLQIETNRFMQVVTSKIRRSEAVFEINDHRISFADPDSTDTIIYSFDGTKLTRNDSLFNPAFPQMFVSDFTIHPDQATQILGARSTLLNVTIALSNSFGDSISLVATIKTKIPDNSVGVKNGFWDF